jgi:hypothetical protein
VWNEHDSAAISEYFDGRRQEEISGHYEPFAGAPATGKVRIVGLDPHLPPGLLGRMTAPMSQKQWEEDPEEEQPPVPLSKRDEPECEQQDHLEDATTDVPPHVPSSLQASCRRMRLRVGIRIAPMG